MRYNPVLHKKSRASRRGIAVMFALGILSLVIVAVLVFSHRAVIDRKVASAYSHYSGSKDLAQSAFGRALLQLKKNAATEDYFYSSGTEDYDWLWKLDPNEKFLKQREIDKFRISWQYVKDSDGHIIGRYAYIVFGSNQLNLNAIMDHSFCKAGTSCDGGTGCLRAQRLGNTATELQFDPSRFTGWFSATFDKDKVQDIKGQYEGPEYLFMGASPKLIPASGVTVADAMNRLSTWFTVSRSSALKEPDAWFGGDGCDGSEANDVKDKNEYYQRFLLNKTETQWDAIAEKSGTGDSAVNEILNPDPSGSAVAFYESGVPKASNTAGIPWLKNWSEKSGNWSSNATKAKQIAANLINYCASEDSPVVSDQTPIITDENNPAWRIPASGQPPYPASNSDNLVPTYTGNKRTWYLNECVALLEIEVQKGTSTKHDVKNGSGVKVGEWFSFSGNKLLIRLYVFPELVNMYGSDVLDGSYSVEGYLDYEFKFTQNMQAKEITTAPYYENIPAEGSEGYGTYLEFSGSSQHQSLARKPSNSTGCYSTPETSTTYYKTFKISQSGKAYVSERTVNVPGNFGWSTNSPSQADIAGLGLFKVKNIKIKNFRLMVRRAKTGLKELVDYAYLPDISVDDEQVLAADPAASPALKKDIVVSDPRHNLHQDDWVTYDLAGKNSDGSWGTLGKVNSMSVAPTGASWSAENGWDKDKETETNPANKSISTAYIRHAPMQSLWELGAIHRAAPWQTINLKKPGSCSDTLSTNLKTAGGGAYGKGDFRILDQVTMQGGTGYTPEAAFGKINLYKPSKFTFDSLFRGMPWQASGKYSDLTETTSSITDSGTLAEKLALTASIPLYRRTDIYQTPAAVTAFWDLIEKSPVDGSALTTDAQQEQLVGRFIGLTTADAVPGDATVIVLAQTIQDLGGGAVVYRDGWNEVLAGYHYNRAGDSTDKPPRAHSKLGDSGYSSTIPAAAYGTYDNGADRITGETKLVGRLLYDRETKKWKIIQVKYED